MSRFDVWAPDAQRVTVVVDGSEYELHPTDPEAERPTGWWTAEVASAGHGSDYAFRIDGGDPTPDPRSLWQPHGVHAASRVYDQSRYSWHDSGWHGLAFAGSVNFTHRSRKYGSSSAAFAAAFSFALPARTSRAATR